MLKKSSIEGLTDRRFYYSAMVRRVGRNRAIVAIARILAELIFTMLKNNKEFIDKMDSLTERKMKSMAEKAKDAKASESIAESVKIIRYKLYKSEGKGTNSGVREVLAKIPSETPVALTWSDLYFKKRIEIPNAEVWHTL
jgi:hypothetical protein